MSKNFTVHKGKVIRDSIYGDIFFPDKYLELIDTPEFQRLRRIHQLSVAFLVFPGAVHNRFSHSIGTYYIMQKIIDHFKPIMKSINCELLDRDIDLALVAALLHDIGHGPFSHIFEKVFLNNKDHEEWGIEIILNQDSRINKILRKNFDEKFPEDLADILRKEKTILHNGLKKEIDEKIDLFFILSGLISSQLDADRMDYLIRDGNYAGIKFSVIDIERLISSMTLTVFRNKYYLCFIDKYLSDIENYLFTRYKMHKEIYLHDIKCEMENIIKKIFRRVVYLLENDLAIDIKKDIPTPLLKLIKGKEISIKEFIKLDDNILLSIFASWVECKDPILSKLCCCIINREKYNKVQILNNEPEQINDFKDDFRKILAKYEYNFDDFNNEYFWIETKERYNIYNKKTDNIWILKNDGTLNDICDISDTINEKLNGEKTITFINFDILRIAMGKKYNNNFIEDVHNLLKMYNNRNYIEIEKKYILENENTYEEVTKAISSLEEYVVSRIDDTIYQEDYYYDTKENLLFDTNKTLRIRKVKNDYRLTIKTPTKSINSFVDDENTQSERFEYETHINSDDIKEHKQYIIKYLPEISDNNNIDNLINTLVIKTNRKKLILVKNDVRFEMVFDKVNYINRNGVEKSDLQIEIELKSDYLHRINLKMLTDYLEKNVSGLRPMYESKYKRGLTLTNNN